MRIKTRLSATTKDRTVQELHHAACYQPRIMIALHESVTVRSIFCSGPALQPPVTACFGGLSLGTARSGG